MGMLLLILNIVVIINFVGFIGILLLKKYRSKTNLLLAFLALNAIMTLVLNISLYYKILNIYPIIGYLSYLFEFIWAPILYYYIYLLIDKKAKIGQIAKVHDFSLFYLVAFFFTWFSFQSSETRNSLLTNLQENNIPWQFMIINYLSLFQFLYFILKSYLFVVKSAKRGKYSDLDINYDKVEWLRKFILVGSILCATMYLPITFMTNLEVYLILIPAALIILYYHLVLGAISSPIIYPKESEQQANYQNLNTKIESKKTPSPNLSLNSPELEYQINEEFINKKLFLVSDLTAQKLAEKLDVKIHMLSAYINQKHNKSLSEFINYFRIEEAKKLLVDPEYKKYSIDIIANSSGFSSRSAFYRAFKKNTGKTPLEFQLLSL